MASAAAAAAAEGSRQRVSKWIQCRRIEHLRKRTLKPRNIKERGGRRRRKEISGGLQVGTPLGMMEGTPDGADEGIEEGMDEGL